MRSSDSLEGNSETSKIPNPSSSPRDSFATECLDKTVSEQVPDTARTLLPLDYTQSSFDEMIRMQGTENLEIHDSFQISAEIGGSVVGSSFDHAVGGDSFLMSDSTSSDEMTNLLESDSALPLLQHPEESNYRKDNTQGSSTLNRLSSETAISTSDHTLVDVNYQKSHSDLSGILQPPAHPTPQSPEPLLSLKEPLRKDIEYASSSGKDTSLQLSGTGACSGVCSSIPRSSPFPTCQCVQKAMVLHEEVETKRTEDSMTLTDYRLSFQKSILNQCNGILRCKECRSISAFAMLIITICERLVCSFQSISRSYLDRLRYQHEQQRQCSDLDLRKKISGDEEGLGGGSSQKVYIGGYCVESPQEQSFLVIRAIELQLRELHNLLITLKDVAVYHGWVKHISMLRAIDEQLQQIRSSSREVPNEALDDASRGSVSRFRYGSLQ